MKLVDLIIDGTGVIINLDIPYFFDFRSFKPEVSQHISGYSVTRDKSGERFVETVPLAPGLAVVLLHVPIPDRRFVTGTEGEVMGF